MNKKKYLFSKNNFVLDLDANTTGNNGEHWIDTSMFAGEGAVQPITAYQPALTNDVFGVGNKGYYFNSAAKNMLVTDNDIISKISEDKPFTLQVRFKLTTAPTTSAVIAKGSGISREWVLYLSSDRFRFHIHSNGSSLDYIGKWVMIPPLINVDYAVKITYDGSKIASGIKAMINNISYSGSSITIGNYEAMCDCNDQIYIGAGSYNSIIGYIGSVKITEGVI